jgi:hypothetical protein
MKRLSTLFALTALAAGTVALAQQQEQQAPAEPPASTSSQQQSPATSSESSSDSMSSSSHADKQTLMKNCMTQTQAANPSAPQKDVKAYCQKQVESYSSQHE